MFLPIGDEPNPRGTPVVNYLLLAANVAAFVFVSLPLMNAPLDLNDPHTWEFLQHLLGGQPLSGLDSFQVQRLLDGVTQYDMFLYEWGFRTAEPGLVTLLTAMFLHGGWMHLAGNMLFLWIYGDNVEHELGRVRYLLAYVGTGVAATLAYALVAPSGDMPMVGASGAISGVLGFYFLWFPRNRVKILVILFPFYFGVWRINARFVLGFYLLVENLLPFWLTRNDTGGGVAYGAHIGGFVAGIAAAWFFSRRGVGKSRQQAAPEHCDGLDVVEICERARQYHAQGDHDAALGLYRRALDCDPAGPDLDLVFLGIATVLLYGKGRPTAAYQYLMNALEADPSPEVRAEIGRLLREIQRRQKLRFQHRDDGW